MYLLGNKDHNFCIIPTKSKWVIIITENNSEIVLLTVLYV